MQIKTMLISFVLILGLAGCDKDVDYSGSYSKTNVSQEKIIKIVPAKEKNRYFLIGVIENDIPIEVKDNKKIIDLNAGFSMGSIIDDNTLSIGDGGAIFKKIESNK